MYSTAQYSTVHNRTIGSAAVRAILQSGNSDHPARVYSRGPTGETNQHLGISIELPIHLPLDIIQLAVAERDGNAGESAA